MTHFSADGATQPGDELDGPPELEFRTGRQSRFKHAKAPQWILLMTDLPHAAFRLYCIMQAHANTERGDGKVWPFQKTLAELMGYSRRASIDPLLDVLQELDLVEVKEVRYGQNNCRRRLVYTVHEEPAEDWVGIASLQEFYAAKAAKGQAAAQQKTTAAEAGADRQRGRDEAAAPPGDTRTSRKPGKASGAKSKRPGTRLSKQQGAALRAVEEAFPEQLRALLPKLRPNVLRDAVMDALEFRSAEQLAERVQRRWWSHGYEAAAAPGGKGLASPVGVAIALVRASTDCPDPQCEDGVRIHTGGPCPKCAERKKDRKGARGSVPEQRSDSGQEASERWECHECHAPHRGERPRGGLCAVCQADAEEAAAAARKLLDQSAEAEARRAEYAAQAWDALVADAYAEHVARGRRDAELRQAQEEAERRRLADQEETRRIREQMAREHPELAAFAQA